MARWFTVLIALVAQGMALMSPECFVRCVDTGGHECVELASPECRCCETPSAESQPQVCVVVTCDRQHDEELEQHTVAPEWQVRSENCDCEHSPLESAPQLRSRSSPSAGMSQTQVFVPAPMTFGLVAGVRTLDVASLRRSLLRPHESPQLAVLATVVLRV
jgi:hypothetical protein